jgi:hypothetical protein
MESKKSEFVRTSNQPRVKIAICGAVDKVSHRNRRSGKRLSGCPDRLEHRDGAGKAAKL